MKKKIIALVAVVMLLFTSVGGTLAYVVTKTDTFFNTFAPTVEPTNGLTVEKTVVHPYGESYVMPSDMTFDFTISLGEYYKLASVKTSLGDITADEAGEVRISLKHGEKFSISELYEGTVITVTETSQKPGFTADEVSKTGVISKDENISFSFTNTYSPSLPREVITLTGEKLLEGREWQEGDKFTLVLEQKKAETWENLATKDVVYSAENSEFNKFDFNDVISAVSFGRLGTYSFRVSEVEGSTGGVEYDSIVSYFDIVVTDNDMDGYMEISEVTGTNSAVVTKNEEGYNVHVSITNTYAPEGTAEFKVNITKTLEDKSGQNKTPSGFTFELSDGTDTLISEPTTAAGETGFGLTFSAADAGKTFVYTLKEVNSGQKGYTYDETAYTFEVEVIDNLDGTVKVTYGVSQMAVCRSNQRFIAICPKAFSTDS